MKIPVVRVLCIVAALAAAVVAAAGSETWYPVLIAAVFFVLAGMLRRGSDETRILLLATGELLVIAVAAVSFPPGFVVQCAVIGAVLFDRTGLPDTLDATLFALWSITALAGALVLDRANQVLLPFLVITVCVVAGTVLLVGVQEMQDRRRYSGGTQ